MMLFGSLDKKSFLCNQLVAALVKKKFCQFGKCSYFCNRFSEEKTIC